MRALYLIFIFIGLFFANIHRAQAQKKPAQPGSVKGALKDTVQKYILRSATISVYSGAKDSTLLNYRIANAYAEFSVDNLPVGVPLRLEVSHTGYVTFKKNFIIAADTKVFDFKTIFMLPRDITLAEVEITVPPISMKGDTLEINPSAFKLDSNAVIEDVLRKTPGLELWGDGTITMNGRNITKVVVDGKEFFGRDPKVALQNLPKQVVEKVQVYREEKPNNLLHSTFTMDVKLKKDKKDGLFGKLGGGYGTKDRYETDGSLNYYNPKLQLGVVGASNNVNRRSSSSSQLLRNATFKGIGASIDNQPEFSQSGVEQPSAYGLDFQYNFIENPGYNNRNVLTASYFGKNLNRDDGYKLQTQTTIADQTQIFSNSQNTNFQTAENQNFNAAYNLDNVNHIFSIRTYGSLDNFKFRNSSTSTELNNERNLVSTNFGQNNTDRNSNNFHIVAGYSTQAYGNKKIFPPFSEMSINYDFGRYENTEASLRTSDFISIVNPGESRKISRNYNTAQNIYSHDLNVSFPHIDDVVKKGGFRNFDLIFNNSLQIKSEKQNDNVFDLDTLSNALRPNNYLTNNFKTNSVENIPALTAQKVFTKSLSNRFDKRITFSISAAQNFNTQNTKSLKAFQNLNKNYSRFVPKASIIATNNQYGDYYQSLTFNYSNSITIPMLNQLAPLVDSTDVYNLSSGNLNLHESKTQSVSISFNHSDQKNKNSVSFYFGINGSISNDAIVDSTLYDAQNRRNIFYVNAKGQKDLGIGGEVKKAYDLKTGKIQLTFAPLITFGKSPSFRNGALNLSNNFTAQNQLKLYYAYGDKIALEGNLSYNYFRSKQVLLNTIYSSNNLSTGISTSYKLTKRFNITSNVDFNRSASSYGNTIDFTIWNASATYRLLKGNNAEIKLSALDLLHQNNSVFSFAEQNVLSTQTRQVLQQYFMATLSYYPRFFGLKGK